MPTKENLAQAFSGESQANRRYLAFAKKAEEEGKKQVARLFRAAAQAETVHAHNHLDTMGEVGTTKDNLKAAVSGENYEHTKMYPDFIKEARDEGNQEAARSFDWANRVEKVHESLFQRALDAMEQGSDIKEEVMHVCPTCGNTFTGEAPEHCPICGTAGSRFMRIE